MKRRRVAALVLLVMVTAMEGAAQTAQDVLENVKKKYESISDAELRFSQDVKFAVANVEQHVSGTLSLKKENKYRIELGEQTIVTNGETVWSYSAPNHQVLIDRYKPDERSLSPEKILAGTPKDFQATLLGHEKVGKTGTVVLKLVTRTDEAYVRSMKLWVDDRDWLIRKVELVDVNGKETSYQVTGIRLNIGLQDSRFTYQIPEGVDVVDLR